MKTTPDWEAIESAYPAGVMSLREIASQHGISEGAIWDAAGKLVLTNESKVLSDLVTVGTPGVNGGINIDQTLSGSWAVAPGMLGSTNIQNNSTQPPTIINITAYSGARFDGANTRINAAPGTTATGVPVGSTNTGIALTAINTASYD